MKTKLYYTMFFTLFALFLTLKIFDGVIVFANMYGDLTTVGSLSQNSARGFGMYLAISLPQLVLMLGGFTAQFILFKKGFYSVVKLIGVLKYVLLPLCYAFNVRWFIGNVPFVLLILPFILFIIMGSVTEALLLSREESIARKRISERFT